MNVKTALTATMATATVLIIAAPDVKAQDAMYTDRTETVKVDEGYQKPSRRRIGRPRGRLHRNLEVYERHLNSHGFTLTRANDVWNAAPNVSASLLQEQIVANQTAGYYESAGSATRTITDTFTKAFEAGDTGSLWAKASFRMTHMGSLNQARVQAEGRLEGALFGNIKTIGLATADVYSPASGTRSAAFQLSVMGQTIWSKNASGATVDLTEGKDWTARLWQTGFDFSIAGYGLGAEVWLEGTVGAHYGAIANGTFAKMSASTGADIAFGGRAWANLGIVYARLDAHLDVVKILVSTEASTRVSVAGRGTAARGTMTARRYTGINLNFLSGYAKIKVKEPLFDSTLGSWTLWNDPDGIFQLNAVLDDYQRNYSLGASRLLR